MATLTGVSISSSYTSLLKLDGNTDSTAAGNGSNAIQVKTGDNEATPLFLNTDRVGIGGQPSEALHITSSDASATPVFLIENTNANNLPGQINFYKNTSDEADDDFLGQIDFEGNDSGANRTVFGRMNSKSTDVSDGSEDGNIVFSTMKAGTLTETLTLQSGNVNINTGDLAIGNSKGDSITTNTEVAIYGGEGGDAILQLLADNADNTADFFGMRQLASGNFTMGHHTGGGFNDTLVISPYASGNNVGIGGTASTELHVQSSDRTSFRLQGTATSDGVVSDIQFFNASDSVGAINMNRVSNDDQSDMTFHTQANGGSVTERMRIDSSGNVGIGTTTIDAKLVVAQASADTALKVSREDQANIQLIASGRGSVRSSASLALQTGGANVRMLLDDNSRISLSNNDSGSGNTVFGYLAGQSIDAGSDNNVFIGERVADATLNDASNNIGLGYYALSSLTIGDNNVVIGSSAGLNITGTSSAVLIGKQAGESINNADALGSVGIGHQALKSNTSGQKNTAIGYLTLSVNNDIGDSNTAVGYEALKNFNPSSDGHGLNTAVGASAGEDVSTGTGNTLIGDKAGNTGSNDITTGTLNTVVGQLSGISASDGTNQTVIGRGVTGQADNSVTLGNADVTDVYMAQDSGATVHCAGIQFPASQSASADANTLDDYEEGSHSPTITGSTSGSMGMNTSFDELAYTKIGRVCTLTGLLYITSDSSISGNIQISLPFTVAQENDSSDLAYGACQLGGTGTAINGTPVIRAQGGNSFATIFVTPNDGGDVTQLTNAEVDGTWFLGFTITYITA